MSKFPTNAYEIPVTQPGRGGGLRRIAGNVGMSILDSLSSLSLLAGGYDTVDHIPTIEPILTPTDQELSTANVADSEQTYGPISEIAAIEAEIAVRGARIATEQLAMSDLHARKRALTPPLRGVKS